MEQCPVCGGSFQGTELICPVCGFDGSADREQYPTLTVPKKRCQSRKEWKAQYEQNRVDVGTIFYKLGDDDTTLYVKSGVTQIEKQDVDSGVERGLMWRRPGEEWKVKKIVLPDSVTKIGKGAFKYCHRLEEVVLGCNVREIEERAFDSCDRLRTVQISSKTDEEERPIKIDNWAFAECENLEEVLLGNPVVEIGMAAFCDCKHLRKVDSLNQTKKIKSRAFKGCAVLQEITFPEEITYMAWNAFSGCPAALEASAKKAAAGIKDQNRFEIDGVKLLGCYGGGRVVSVPQGIRVIGEESFYQNDTVEEVTLPEGVVEIRPMAFRACSKLRRIRLPESLRKIGGMAFGGCTALTQINIPDGVKEIGDSTFGEPDFSKFFTYYEIDLSKYSTFSGCTALKKVKLPSGLQGIERNTFEDCSSLRMIRIPAKVKYIKDEAFYGCSALWRVVFEGKPPHIDSTAFGMCHSLLDPRFWKVKERPRGDRW